MNTSWQVYIIFSIRTNNILNDAIFRDNQATNKERVLPFKVCIQVMTV